LSAPVSRGAGHGLQSLAVDTQNFREARSTCAPCRLRRTARTPA